MMVKSSPVLGYLFPDSPFAVPCFYSLILSQRGGIFFTDQLSVSDRDGLV